MTNDTFKVTSEFEEFLKSQKNNNNHQQSIFINNDLNTSIDFTKIISDTLSLNKQNEVCISNQHFLFNDLI